MHDPPIRERRFNYTPLSRIHLSEHYRLREFCIHDLSLIYGIKNVPAKIGIERARPMAEKLLEPLHDHFGELRILQGYVSPALNAKRMQMGAVAGSTKGNRHWWDREPELGLNAAVCVDFCIRGREGNIEAQRELVEACYALEIPFDGMLIFPRTSSIEITYDPTKSRKYASIRMEYLAHGYPKSDYFQVWNPDNIPWQYLQMGTYSAITEAKAWMAERGEGAYRKKASPRNFQEKLF
ncbi:MAG: hypothetical protein FOGNACKC_00740 [Anaerolineae bacterium]|nr:hypothetical protein [Anaerolineae bacterium]